MAEGRLRLVSGLGKVCWGCEEVGPFYRIRREEPETQRVRPGDDPQRVGVGCDTLSLCRVLVEARDCATVGYSFQWRDDMPGLFGASEGSTSPDDGVSEQR